MHSQASWAFTLVHVIRWPCTVWTWMSGLKRVLANMKGRQCFARDILFFSFLMSHFWHVPSSSPQRGPKVMVFHVFPKVRRHSCHFEWHHRNLKGPTSFKILKSLMSFTFFPLTQVLRSLDDWFLFLSQCSWQSFSQGCFWNSVEQVLKNIWHGAICTDNTLCSLSLLQFTTVLIKLYFSTGDIFSFICRRQGPKDSTKKDGGLHIEAILFLY